MQVVGAMGQQGAIPPPRRMDSDEDPSDYLAQFTTNMQARGLPKQSWPAVLQPLLNRKARLAMAALTTEEQSDWDKLKKAVLSSEGDLYLQANQQFFDLAKEADETFIQYGKKLHKLATRITGNLNTVESVREKFALERLIAIMPFIVQSL